MDSPPEGLGICLALYAAATAEVDLNSEQPHSLSLSQRCCNGSR